MTAPLRCHCAAAAAFSRTELAPGLSAWRLKHGDACMDELTRLRDWLDAQPQRDELLSLLRAGW